MDVWAVVDMAAIGTESSARKTGRIRASMWRRMEKVQASAESLWRRDSIWSGLSISCLLDLHWIYTPRRYIFIPDLGTHHVPGTFEMDSEASDGYLIKCTREACSKV